MAFVNPNKPAGLTPVRYLNGAKYNGGVRLYAILSSDGNAYSQGDLVALTGTGDAAGVPGITLATAGATAVGVLVAVGVGSGPTGLAGIGAGAGGPYINPNNLALVQAPAAKTQNYYAAVVDDPNVIFEIQEGGTGTNLTQANIGLNANILYAAPATGVVVSGTTMNNVGTATTSTLNLKILGLVQRADNHFTTTPTTGGGAQKWNVLINNHSYRAGITGV